MGLSLCVFFVPAYISYFENRDSNFALNSLIFLEGLKPMYLRASKFDEIIQALVPGYLCLSVEPMAP